MLKENKWTKVRLKDGLDQIYHMTRTKVFIIWLSYRKFILVIFIL